MNQFSARMDGSGRVVIPRDLREALGIPDGGELRLTIRDGALYATTRAAALHRIQAGLRALAPAKPLSEVLIADRRAEARRGVHENQATAPEADG